MILTAGTSIPFAWIICAHLQQLYTPNGSELVCYTLAYQVTQFSGKIVATYRNIITLTAANPLSMASCTMPMNIMPVAIVMLLGLLLYMYLSMK